MIHSYSTVSNNNKIESRSKSLKRPLRTHLKTKDEKNEENVKNELMNLDE
jgi:hypothetical protein